jgi:hypothetical protein
VSEGNRFAVIGHQRRKVGNLVSVPVTFPTVPGIFDVFGVLYRRQGALVVPRRVLLVGDCWSVEIGNFNGFTALAQGNEFTLQVVVSPDAVEKSSQRNRENQQDRPKDESPLEPTPAATLRPLTKAGCCA